MDGYEVNDGSVIGILEVLRYDIWFPVYNENFRIRETLVTFSFPF